MSGLVCIGRDSDGRRTLGRRRLFSRPLITLIAVALGTWAGMHVPSWQGWKIDGMGLGVAGALVLGTSGYLLHRTWVGAGLAIILAAWLGAAAIQIGDPTAVLPAFHLGFSLIDSMTDLWKALPTSLYPALPIACAAGVTAGAVEQHLLAEAEPGDALQSHWYEPDRWPGFSGDSCHPNDLAGHDSSPPFRSGSRVLLMVALGILIQWQLIPEVAEVRSSGAGRSPVAERQTRAQPRLQTKQTAVVW